MISTTSQARKELAKYKNESRRLANLNYFKTGPGDYGEGDLFIGIEFKLVFSVLLLVFLSHGTNHA